MKQASPFNKQVIQLPLPQGQLPSPYSFKTFAKLNLSLRVAPPLKNGFHPICSVFQSISLYDEITITPILSKEIIFTSNHEKVPKNEHNIMFKILSHFVYSCGFKIHIEKQIPIGGGLGGGSSNAAGLIVALNHLFQLQLPYSKMHKIAESVGTDIPFFLTGGLAIIEGIGTKITPLKNTLKRQFILIVPNIESITQTIYQNYDKQNSATLITEEDATKLKITHLGPNDLKDTVWQSNPEYQKIETTLLNHHIIQKGRLQLSGSGATLFISYLDPKLAQNQYQEIKNLFPQHRVLYATSNHQTITT